MPKPPLRPFQAPRGLQLAALWTSLMFLYVYGDYFNMYLPGKLESMAAGNLGSLGEATEGVLVGVAILMAIPSLMIGASVLLKPEVARVLNIVVGIAYTIIIAMTMVNAAIFYIVLGMFEIALSAGIAWLAFTWQRIEPGPNIRT